MAEPEALDDETMLRLATEFEGHPDNAAPAIWGGATVAWLDHEGAHAVPLEVAKGIETAVLIPRAVLPTEQARAALPAQVPHADAAINVGRASLLVAALSGHPERLWAATADRLHQGYRASAMPAAAAMIAYLRERGLPAMVSGAGPSVLVIGTALAGGGLVTGTPDWAEGIGGDSWRCVHTTARVPGVTVSAS
jgi:homoserine kinase